MFIEAKYKTLIPDSLYDTVVSIQAIYQCALQIKLCDITLLITDIFIIPNEVVIILSDRNRIYRQIQETY